MCYILPETWNNWSNKMKSRNVSEGEYGCLPDFVYHEDGRQGMDTGIQTCLDQTVKSVYIHLSEQRSFAVHHNELVWPHLQIQRGKIKWLSKNKNKIIKKILKGKNFL